MKKHSLSSSSAVFSCRFTSFFPALRRLGWDYSTQALKVKKMTKERMNCWEVAACGLEPRGKNVSTDGICLAALEQRDNNIHPGLNAGSCCRIDPELLYQAETWSNYAKKLLTPQGFPSTKW
ncbi:MAG: hypothetical protein D3903_17395 [Candidatus Electrothrix sp. GM3_4]|nr:hypothetical protein [Candidatus Electrothrix sp. GM3_4]